VWCCRLVEAGGGSWMGLGLAVWRGAVASSLAAAASAVRGAGPGSSWCDGPVDYLQQACVAVQRSMWEVAFLGVWGGRLVGSASGLTSLALSSSATSRRMSTCLPVVWQMLGR